MITPRTILPVVALTVPVVACASPGTSPGPSPGTSPGASPVPAAAAAAMEARPVRAVYTGTGADASLEEVVEAMGDVSVVFVGEQHDDSLGHMVEMELLAAAYRRWSGSAAPWPHRGGASARGDRSLVLSLEMFERDVQGVVDEYLEGLITEEHFLASARPWDQYATAYRPMVEFARVHDLEVVAANAPRRYVNLVAREGLDVLDRLSAEAQEHLPPRPVPEPSNAYRAQWDSVTGGAAAHAHMPPHMLEAQMLWDAAMADAVAGALERNEDALVVHYTGAFHVSGGTGTPEVLRAYRPDTEDLVVVIRPSEDPRAFPEELAGAGDFVILTRAPAEEASEEAPEEEEVTGRGAGG